MKLKRLFKPASGMPIYRDADESVTGTESVKATSARWMPEPRIADAGGSQRSGRRGNKVCGSFLMPGGDPEGNL